MGYKGCTVCGKTMRDDGSACPHCQATGAEASTPPVVRQRSRVVAWLGLIVAGFVVWVFVAALGQVASERGGASGGGTGSPVLDLLSSNGSAQHGYHQVEGQVRNLTSERQPRVQVVVEWYTKDGTFVASDSTLIEYDPLMPDQASPFKSLVRSNPQMDTYKVAFKRLTGATLFHRDSRKK